MRKVLIIGATGTLGSAVRKALLTETDDRLTLFSRSAKTIQVTNAAREVTAAGNVMNDIDLSKVIEGQDAVFAALAGDLGTFAKKITRAMEKCQVSRLVFITSMGIYNEIPASLGSGNLKDNPVLQPYRNAADVIEATDLNYTIIRPGWFTNGPVDYEVTHKGDPFSGHDVSISSLADLVKRLVDDDQLYSCESIGVNTPAK